MDHGTTLQERRLTAAVMRRVFVVHYLRSLFVPAALLVLAIGSGLIGLLIFVSVRDVWVNSTTAVSQGTWFSYGISAVSHTERVLQILLAAGTVAAACSLTLFYKRFARSTRVFAGA